jgi:hypothetical protein
LNQNTTGNAATANNVSGGTANVTTLTTSSTVTLNGGTANGVAYLNGSKVLTTGSALTFDGSTLIAPAGGLQLGAFAYFTGGVTSNLIAGTNAVYGLELRTNSATRYQINSDGTSIWSMAGTEQMRLTSTGLGIGTSSPGGKLDVASSNTNDDGIFLTPDGSSFGYASNITFRSKLTNGGSIGIAAKIRAELSSSNNAGLLFFTTASGTNAEKMRLDSAGNLGIGTTSPATRLELSKVYVGAGPTWAGGDDLLKLTAASGSAWAEPAIAFHEIGSNIGAKIGVKNTGNGAMNIIFANRDGSSLTSTMTERARISTDGAWVSVHSWQRRRLGNRHVCSW